MRNLNHSLRKNLNKNLNKRLKRNLKFFTTAIAVITQINLIIVTYAQADRVGGVVAAGSSGANALGDAAANNALWGDGYFLGYEASEWTNGLLLAGMVVSYLQAGQSDRDRRGAEATRDAAQCIGAYCDNNNNNNNNNNGTPRPPGSRPTTPTTTTGTPRLPGTGSPTLNTLLTTAENRLNDLRAQGYEFSRDSGTITTPDGKKINLAALSSPSGMKAAGFSDKDINEFLQTRDKIANDVKNNKLLNQIAGELEGGGGGGRKKNADGGSGRDSAGIDYSKLFAGLNKKDTDGSRGLAGLEKKLGKDSIGLAQDNIFDMIHRRYNIKQPELTP